MGQRIFFFFECEKWSSKSKAQKLIFEFKIETNNNFLPIWFSRKTAKVWKNANRNVFIESPLLENQFNTLTTVVNTTL